MSNETNCLLYILFQTLNPAIAHTCMYSYTPLWKHIHTRFVPGRHEEI